MDVNGNDNHGTQQAWTCGCGKENQQRFCSRCGQSRPEEAALTPVSDSAMGGGGWVCSCGAINRDRFCIKCGQAQPTAEEVGVDQPATEAVTLPEPGLWTCACGRENRGKFCTKCGQVQPPAGNVAAPLVSADFATQVPATEMGGEIEQAAPEPESALSLSPVPHPVPNEGAEEARQADWQGSQPFDGKAPATGIVPPAASDKQEEPSNFSLLSGKMKFVMLGVLVLALAVVAWFVFGNKGREAPPDTGNTKLATDVKGDSSGKADSSMALPDAGRQEAKLKDYAKQVKQTAEEVKQEAVKNQKIVFMVEDVQKSGNDLVVFGKFFNGKTDRTITSVKEMEFDISLRDFDTVIAELKDVRYATPYTGLQIKPMETTSQVSITLAGKAPQKSFNNFTVKGHHIHWEGKGR